MGGRETWLAFPEVYGNKRSQARQRERGKQKGWDRLVLVSSCFQRSFDIHPWKALLVGCCWLLLLVCSTGDLLKHCLAIYISYSKYSLTVSLKKKTAFPIRCPGERSKYTQEIREDETHGIGGGQNKSKQQPNGRWYVSYVFLEVSHIRLGNLHSTIFPSAQKWCIVYCYVRFANRWTLCV